MSMDTYGIIGFTTDNVGIDRRFYTGRTDTDPTLAVSYNERRVDVYLNGIKLVGDHPGNSNHDYDIDAQTGQGSSITLKTGVALVASDVIECIGYVSLSGNTVTSHNPTPTSGDGGFNEFRNIGQASSDLLNVYLNGVLLDDSDYTSDPTTNNGTVTIGSPAITASDVVVIQVIGTLNNSNFVPAGGGTFSGNVAYTGNIQVDDIVEKTSAHGVEIDGVTLKDGSGTFSSTAGAGVTLIDSDDKPNGWELRANGTRFQIGEAGVADRFAIKAGGNTGIGTVNPTLGILQVENSSSNSNIAINAPGSGAHSELYHITANRRYNVGLHGTTNKYFIYDNNAGAYRLDIDTSGNVQVVGGNLVIGTAGKGIDFSTTSDGTGSSSVSEILSDYETGTWTPTLQTAGGGTDYFSGYGLNWLRRHYTRIGNVVYLEINVVDFDHVDLPSSGTVTFGNIPFSTPTTGAQWRACGSGSISSQYNCTVMIDNYADHVINLSYGTTTYVSWSDVGSLSHSRISFGAIYHTG